MAHLVPVLASLLSLTLFIDQSSSASFLHEVRSPFISNVVTFLPFFLVLIPFFFVSLVLLATYRWFERNFAPSIKFPPTILWLTFLFPRRRKYCCHCLPSFRLVFFFFPLFCSVRTVLIPSLPPLISLFLRPLSSYLDNLWQLETVFKPRERKFNQSDTQTLFSASKFKSIPKNENFFLSQTFSELPSLRVMFVNIFTRLNLHFLSSYLFQISFSIPHFHSRTFFDSLSFGTEPNKNTWMLLVCCWPKYPLESNSHSPLHTEVHFVRKKGIKGRFCEKVLPRVLLWPELSEEEECKKSGNWTDYSVSRRSCTCSSHPSPDSLPFSPTSCWTGGGWVKHRERRVLKMKKKKKKKKKKGQKRGDERGRYKKRRRGNGNRVKLLLRVVSFPLSSHIPVLRTSSMFGEETEECTGMKREEERKKGFTDEIEEWREERTLFLLDPLSRSSFSRILFCRTLSKSIFSPHEGRKKEFWRVAGETGERKKIVGVEGRVCERRERCLEYLRVFQLSNLFAFGECVLKRTNAGMESVLKERGKKCRGGKWRIEKKKK